MGCSVHIFRMFRLNNSNFDYLKKLRDEALSKGRGSKAYFKFCDAVFDGFPKIYETALALNAKVFAELPRVQILAEIERITKGLIENNEEVVDILWINNFETALDALSSLYEFVGGNEDLQLKLWPENDISNDPSVIAGTNLTTSGMIGQP